MVKEFLPENLKKYWPTVDEEGDYTGPFSRFAEYHAAGIGLGAAATCNVPIMVAVVAYTLGIGGHRKRKGGHWRDLVEEPAYGLGGLAVGRYVFCHLGLEMPWLVEYLPF